MLLVTSCAIAQSGMFTNPLLPSGADPYSFYKDGYYYYTNTTGRNVTIWKTRNLADLKTAERRVIYDPPPNTMYSRDIWAPQIQFIRGKWYSYFAADDGDNKNHRMYVIENSSEDPMKGEWVFKGKVADVDDKWAIDGDVFEHRGQLYMIWSGWPGDVNFQQNIYIAKMKNPWTIEGRRVRISTPELEWEKFGDLKGDPSHVDVNEGPQVLKNRDKLFIVYSASGCWTDKYSLGLLTFTGRNNLLDSTAWKKSPQPVFQQQPEIGVYAPGHNSFFKSPDGKEDWILYHANSQPGQGCGRFRSPRAQKFSWKRDGTPDFGMPVAAGLALQLPSGTSVNKTQEDLVRESRYHYRLQDSGRHLYLADPTVFYHNDTYYVYGTVEGNSSGGFLVYTSKDMRNWKLSVKNEGGYALRKGDAYGERGFWAPQVFFANNRYYMAYVANENIAIAHSDHPEGPFVQEEKVPLAAEVKQIDPFVYIDSDGRKYLYHVRLGEGNRLFVAEMTNDFSAIKPETLRECITASEKWENTQNVKWPVAEGPTILKRDSLYYFTYTANDFRNPDYAVGYAVSKSPLGPWKKFSGNPILSRKDLGVNGTGHGDFFRDKNGRLFYVFHTHNSPGKVGPRRTAIVRAEFVRQDSGKEEKIDLLEESVFYPVVER